MDATPPLSEILALDFETTLSQGRLHGIGGVIGERVVQASSPRQVGRALAELDGLAKHARFVLGHNLIEHDLEVLQQVRPESPILKLPVIDTLLLSPLAHPENPYHRLIKDYKLTSGSQNDPVADARLAIRVFEEQFHELPRRYPAETGLLSVIRTWFAQADATGDRGGLERVFAALGGRTLDQSALRAAVRAAVADRCCRTALTSLLDGLGSRDGVPLAYVIAWLRVSGAQSVLPAFVRRRFPVVTEFARSLRERDCRQPECSWCREQHDARAQLRRYFGFEEFRSEPADAEGRGLQQQIVEHGMAGGSHLAILPTGGGKSLCFQLPALVRNHRRGVLTIVISPLQALMKDQVEGLRQRTNTDGAATLNGLLTPPERAQALDDTRKGSVSILYVSPEQLRNTSFRRAVRQREIGAWVFDEAHCLSKWGHDFRPDYLYAGRFIRELAVEQRVDPPPIACMTATAKREVREEIVRYFRQALDRELTTFDGGVERDELSYRVEEVELLEKPARVYDVVSDCLDRHRRGSVIVYHATRKKADEMAEYLRNRDVEALSYHAGLNAPERKRVQDEFIADGARVICATNAFGMGVDKECVRLVVHAEIPGSLENYLQEAGRAGRDRAPAEAMLLYDPADLEMQFDFARRARLSVRDIQQILRGLRKFGRRKQEDFAISSGELLRDDGVDASFGAEDRDASTKVVTAISWLERAGFLQRNENLTRVFQGVPALPLADAKAKIATLDLQPLVQDVWVHLLEVLANAEPDEGLTVDDLAGGDVVQALARLEQGRVGHHRTGLQRSGAPPIAARVAEPSPDYGDEPLDPRLVTKVILRAFHDMAKVGLIRTGLRLTAFVRHKVVGSSEHRLSAIDALESTLLDRLRELAPDAGTDEWQVLSLRGLNELLRRDHSDAVPESIRKLLFSLSQDGRGMAGSRASLLVRQRTRDRFAVRLQRDWSDLVETSQRRREVANVCLRALLARVPRQEAASAELLVDFALDDLTKAIDSDLLLRGRIKDPIAAVERALLYLHEHRVIVLQRGLAVFHPAMTMRLARSEKGRRYTKSDYEPLREHYQERTLQIHVMDRYARIGTSSNGTTQKKFVRAYFDEGQADFLKRFFPQSTASLERATGQQSYDAIVTGLRSEIQQEIVTAPPDQNQLVLAGPGSGKTRVVVHRCAWLLRVARVSPAGILVLCFNRSTARELRTRLRALVGDASSRVTIQTYDGLALRLVGRSLADMQLGGEKQRFDQFLEEVRLEATQLLSGGRTVAGLDPDDLRDAMLIGYEQVLVDEYQDIDESQYELISAIAGRIESEDDRKLGILAVGDDDQNIYDWRGSDTRFIRQFESDYGATVRSLPENHRSTPNIVAASAQLIAHNADRMKSGGELRPAPERARAGAGGEWGDRDPESQGRVQRVTAAGAQAQAHAVVDEILRVRGRCPARELSDFAVVARKWRELDAMRGLLEDRGIPCRYDRSRGLPSLFRVREVDQVLAALRARRERGLMIGRAELAGFVPQLRQGVLCPWWDYASSLVTGFLDERTSDGFAAGEVLDGLAESILYDRDRNWFGEGVLLATAHSVKGREFPFVFMLDGGWDSTDANKIEAERRLYYVGMTRAIDGLWLGRRSDQSNPFVSALGGGWLVDRDASPASSGQVFARRYSLLRLDEMWLDFAGRRKGSIHRELAGLHAGDHLEFRRHDDWIHLCAKKVAVAALSKAGREMWGPRLDAIERAQVICMIQRKREDGDRPTEHRDLLEVDEWSLPLVEVLWREPG